MPSMRRQVLQAFKNLHRAREHVFKGDERALFECRKQINENFRKNKAETNVEDVKKMLQLAIDVEKELRTNVIQAVEKEQGVYALRITEETTRLDNYPYDPFAVISKPKRKRTDTSSSGCCGGSKT